MRSGESISTVLCVFRLSAELSCQKKWGRKGSRT